MPSHLGKPQDLSGLYNSLKRIYAPYHAKVAEARDAYNQNFNALVQVPDGVSVHRSSTARTIVDNLADTLRTDSPRVAYRASGTSQKAQKRKELLETWGLHIIRSISDYTIVDVIEQSKKDLLRDGVACVKFLVEPDFLEIAAPRSTNYKNTRAYAKALKEWEEERSEHWPYLVKALDVTAVYPNPWSHRLDFIVEVQKRHVMDLEARFPDFQRQNRWHDMTELEWIEYWSADHYIVEVGGQRVIDKPNPYGVVPYAWAWNGLGRNDASSNIQFLGEPVLNSIIGELHEEVRTKTAMGAQWQFHVFPRLVTTEDERTARRKFMKGPGAVIKVASMDQAPQWLNTPPPNDAMFAYLNSIQQAIAERFPPGLNQRPAGVETGVHQAMLMGAASRSLLPIKKALDKLMTSVLKGMANQLVSLDFPMNVWGTTDKLESKRMVRSEDFQSYEFSVTYENTDPAEEDRRLMTGLSLLRVPSLLSRKTFRETFARGLNLHNEEEEEQILVEQTMDMVSQQGLLMQAVMEATQAMEQSAAMGEAIDVQGQMGAQARDIPGARERILEGMSGQPVPGPGGPTAGAPQGPGGA